MWMLLQSTTTDLPRYYFPIILHHPPFRPLFSTILSLKSHDDNKQTPLKMHDRMKEKKNEGKTLIHNPPHSSIRTPDILPQETIYSA